jgi:hypothetical protein
VRPHAAAVVPASFLILITAVVSFASRQALGMVESLMASPAPKQLSRVPQVHDRRALRGPQTASALLQKLSRMCGTEARRNSLCEHPFVVSPLLEKPMIDNTALGRVCAV